MSVRPDIEGVEFDWFAIDRLGRVAIFATAGAGIVPDSVISIHSEHAEMSDSLDTSTWGSEKVWDYYANLGIFVYDWKLPDGPYRLVREPTNDISTQLLGRLKSLTLLPKLDVEFRNCKNISRLRLADSK